MQVNYMLSGFMKIEDELVISDADSSVCISSHLYFEVPKNEDWTHPDMHILVGMRYGTVRYVLFFVEVVTLIDNVFFQMDTSAACVEAVEMETDRDFQESQGEICVVFVSPVSRVSCGFSSLYESKKN